MKISKKMRKRIAPILTMLLVLKSKVTFYKINAYMCFRDYSLLNLPVLLSGFALE